MPIPKEILYLTEADVQKTLSVAEAVNLAEKGIKADGAGNVKGDKFYMDVNDDGFIKPFSGYIAGEEYAFVKSFSYFPGNPEKYNRPTTCSQVILIDYETGLPACFMGADWGHRLENSRIYSSNDRLSCPSRIGGCDHFWSRNFRTFASESSC